MIPFSDPSASYQSHKNEIDQAITRVLGSMFVLGQEVEAFEEEFASFHGTDFHCVGVANGTDAIALALRCLGMKDGEEVITPSHTAVATVSAIEQAGCKPVFADIDPVTRCICPNPLNQEFRPKQELTYSATVFAEKFHLSVVEDCSQAHAAETNGQKVGTFGDLATFSCYPTKNLGALGDGGVILSRTKHFAKTEEGSGNMVGMTTEKAFLRVSIPAWTKSKQPSCVSSSSTCPKTTRSEGGSPINTIWITLPQRKDTEKHAMHLATS